MYQSADHRAVSQRPQQSNGFASSLLSGNAVGHNGPSAIPDVSTFSPGPLPGHGGGMASTGIVERVGGVRCERQ